jgi:NAD(P)-dependent dehydrogenase (short-subunit alcohol dehydrogenase family)
MSSPRVVIITGAAGNLGRACAEVFSSRGWRCGLVDRDAGRLAGATAAGPDRLLVGDVDLADARGASGAVDRVLAWGGRVDALVNTVGGYAGGTPIGRTSFADWEAMLNANLRPTLAMCAAVLPTMVRQRSGRIVNVASRHALGAPAGHGPYAAAKSAVVRLSEALAHEHRADGVACTCVLPTTLDTPINRAAMPGADFSAWLSPASLAGVIEFLCTDGAKDLSGAAIPVG